MHRRDVLKATSFTVAMACGMTAAPLFAKDVRVQHMGLSVNLPNASIAYRWMNVLLDLSARDVIRYQARPTVLSRSMGIVTMAMYEAWASFDDKARGIYFDGRLRRPKSERILQNKEAAISFAAAHALLDIYPEETEAIYAALRGFGYKPEDGIASSLTAPGIGVLTAETLTADRHRDGANQMGDEPGSSGRPYSDYTQYLPVNPPDRIFHPDRWQPIPFLDGRGGTFAPGFLTPHWYRVKPFALTSCDQFRAPPPPKVGSAELLKDIDQVIAFNAGLTPDQKALVEFMRDGPGSTGQSGHWLRIAQDVSRRDHNDLDADVKLFLTVGMAAMDAFIASWDSKRHYDTSRPWTLVRHYYGDRMLHGWGGPGKGTIELKGSEWYPYSPYEFVSPPFPSYVSGHSTVSAASGEALRLLTGSDHFGAELIRHPGEITEPDFVDKDVRLFLPTFTETANMAGISRVYGGYHIEADNREGLAMGRKVAAVVYERVQDLFG
jgi:hypothetical protein